jgi:filamentous hemagglutinin family protein
VAHFDFNRLILSLGLWSLANAPAIAQPILPANDGTHTQVFPTGNQFQITGGTQTGANLFHSFEQFGLNQGQVADFQANPDVANILGRVIGGDASIINGLLRVSGGSPSLYLLNPAGILFGPDAQLDLPGSLFVTTGAGIGFESGIFHAFESNNYSTLVGHPNRFIFATNGGGTIVNLGNLTLAPQQHLALVGSTVVNTGTLSAPGGEVAIVAVPDGHGVHLHQNGMVLNLQFDPLEATLDNPLLRDGVEFNPLALPDLLTGGNFGNASQLRVQTDGTIELTGSGLRFAPESGMAVVSGTVVSGTIDSANITGISGGVGGTIGVFGDRVALVQANLDASGGSGGGTVLVGGEFQGQGPVPNAMSSFVDPDSRINVNGVTDGDGGRAIVWADRTTRFFGTITATGGNIGGNGGFVEISGKDRLSFDGWVDTSAPQGIDGTILFDPANINIVAGVGADDAQVTGDREILFADSGAATFEIGATTLGTLGGTLLLQATNNININSSLSTYGGATITLGANNDININSAITVTDTGGTANLILDADNDINVNADITNTDTNFGHVFNLSLTADGNINASGVTISTAQNRGDAFLAFGTAEGGALTLTAGGNIVTGALNTFGRTSAMTNGAGKGGNVTLMAGGSISTGGINSNAVAFSGNPTVAEGGNVSLMAGSTISVTGDLNTRAIINSNNGANQTTGGTVTLTAGNTPGSNISFSTISTDATSDGNTNTSGNVTLAAMGTVQGTGVDASGDTIDTKAGGAQLTPTVR